MDRRLLPWGFDSLPRYHIPKFSIMSYPILQFFKYDHLPEKLQGVSRPFCELAARMAENLPPGAEVSAGLRKLLEAKDCAVRAMVPAPAVEMDRAE